MYDLDFEIKDKYDIDDLLEVTRILRSENGCPWDREQDHKSVRMNVLEEAYEVMEAIDVDDAAMLKEELGDLLFQAVFHCEIEKERGRFEFNDICDDVTKKMIYRHPHVFGDVNVNNSDDVLKTGTSSKRNPSIRTPLRILLTACRWYCLRLCVARRSSSVRQMRA